MNDFPESENPFASPQTTEPVTVAQVTGPVSSIEDLPSRWLRLGASLIDSLVVGLVSIPVGLVLIAILASAGSEMSPVALELLGNVVGLLVGFGIFMAVNNYLLAKHGQTVGKMACGIKIVDYNDHRIKSLGHIMRMRVLPITFVTQIPLVGPIVGLVNVLMIFTPKSVACMTSSPARSW
ncbi:RDD family protein [Blastopirellula retiformator]|uniref:RDD family protein n=1 Tax=Blastopirellula retiformator TaxID=2527970 RepID=UPI001C95F214|nr:RDD family protein [Blastopirellula retiformator]